MAADSSLRMWVECGWVTDMATLENKLVVFKGKNIRRSLHNNEWYFSGMDVVAAVAEKNRRESKLEKFET